MSPHFFLHGASSTFLRTLACLTSFMLLVSCGEFPDCNENQLRIAYQAREEMRILVNYFLDASKTNTSLTRDIAIMDFFGNSTLNIVSTEDILAKIESAGSRGVRVHCSASANESRCNFPNYGGLFSLNGTSTANGTGVVDIVLCEGFFQMPSLQEKIAQVVKNRPWRDRFNLTSYASNRATVLLRQMMQQSPAPVALNRPIVDKWILMTTRIGTPTDYPDWHEGFVDTQAWIGCYDVVCARTLAMVIALETRAGSLSALNAANYAYATLAHYIQSMVFQDQSYPFYPEAERIALGYDTQHRNNTIYQLLWYHGFIDLQRESIGQEYLFLAPKLLPVTIEEEQKESTVDRVWSWGPGFNWDISVFKLEVLIRYHQGPPANTIEGDAFR